LKIEFLPLPVDPIQMAMACSLRSTGVTPLYHYYEAVAPSRRIGTFRLAVGAAYTFSIGIAVYVPTFRAVELRAAYMPMPLGPTSGFPRADPRGMVTPGFGIA